MRTRQNIYKIYTKYTQNIPKIVGKKVIESSLFGTASGRQTILGLFWTLYRNSRNQKRNRNTESTVFRIFDLIFFADKPGYIPDRFAGGKISRSNKSPPSLISWNYQRRSRDTIPGRSRDTIPGSSVFSETKKIWHISSPGLQSL